ncbi:DNA polymerase IV [Pseudonocardia sp. RS010]|uniref:DNA polymerase IV n=1 Tax=Pseudonocardia sp. RS010 TaxID=3385979 RepID=UPI00399F2D4D
MNRWVLHLDMDAFFASVEQLTRPTLAERPVLVGGTGGRGVVAGASYQARVFGARSAMPMGQARRRCPHATVLPPRFPLYKVISEEVMGVLREAAPVLEPVSVDEAFLEPPALAGASAAEVEEFCVALRAEVRARTGLPASVGAGSGKQVAKIASELAKPDGLTVVAPAVEREVLDPLPVRSLWGVGPVAEAALRTIGVETIGALAAMDAREVAGVLGSTVGAELHRLARGIDERPVAPRGAAKQISAESTFEHDLTAMADVLREVGRMTAAAHRRLVVDGRAARTVTVKARNADFQTHTRSETTAFASTDLATLTAVAQRLARTAVPEGGVRLVGVSLSGLSDSPPPALFEAVPSESGWTTAPPTQPVETVEADTVLTVETSEGTHPEPGTEFGPRPGGRHGSRDPASPWRAGDDVAHAVHGHGWVQGAGHGRVTVRFETRATGPGPARTFAADDPALSFADPVESWRLPSPAH